MYGGYQCTRKSFIVSGVPSIDSVNSRTDMGSGFAFPAGCCEREPISGPFAGRNLENHPNTDTYSVTLLSEQLM